MNIVIIEAVAGNQPEELANFILRICREEDLSFRQIADRAKRKGYKIAQSYISKIVSGSAQNLTLEKIEALAAGLNRTYEEVAAVAKGRPLKQDDIDDAILNAIAHGYPKLTKKDREEVAILLRLIDREIKERLDK